MEAPRIIISQKSKRQYGMQFVKLCHQAPCAPQACAVEPPRCFDPKGHGKHRSRGDEQRRSEINMACLPIDDAGAGACCKHGGQ